MGQHASKYHQYQGDGPQSDPRPIGMGVQKTNGDWEKKKTEVDFNVDSEKPE